MNKKQKNLLIRVISAGVMMAVLLLLPLDDKPILRFALFMIPYLTVGYDILRKAFKGIMNRQVFDENFLMGVATIGAMALGEYTEGVAVMWFYQIGELFQSYAVGKSRQNISDLMDIRPDYANIEEDGQIEKVDPDDVEVGSTIVVNPGEKVPIDGVIIEGHTTLNTAALTGESIPADVQVGDEVIFEDMIHYTTVKTNTFNGITHPSLCMLHADGQLELLRRFTYEDYRNRMD